MVVQYEARGFLRGGTGDQYPVFPMAAQGLAVFVVNNPRDVSPDAPRCRPRRPAPRPRSPVTKIGPGVETPTPRCWLDLAQVFALDLIDQRRLGITGMSDGSGAVQWALLNSDLFSAAAVSNCCDDEFSMNVAGPLAAARLRAYGFPYPSAPSALFDLMSLARNAERMSTPYLMHISDSELLFALPTITALQGHAQPAELYVYPDEFHIKWQPAHRAAIYRRSIDWFKFWLSDEVDAAPDKADQYRRWKAMRTARTASLATSARPAS
ncbi:prolyl oligopeptidase family serine peptidase [Caulobacter segnis]